MLVMALAPNFFNASRMSLDGQVIVVTSGNIVMSPDAPQESTAVETV